MKVPRSSTGPGVSLPMATASANCRSVSQPRVSMTDLRCGTMAKPPPYAPRPVRKNVSPICSRSASTPVSRAAARTENTAAGQGEESGSGGLEDVSRGWPSSGNATGGSWSLLRRRRTLARRARLVPRSTASPAAMATSTISPGGAFPTALKSSASAATPICQRRLTLVRTILSVMLAMIPTTAALKPPSTVARSGVVPKRTYAGESGQHEPDVGGQGAAPAAEAQADVGERIGGRAAGEHLRDRHGVGELAVGQPALPGHHVRLDVGQDAQAPAESDRAEVEPGAQEVRDARARAGDRRVGRELRSRHVAVHPRPV